MLRDSVTLQTTPRHDDLVGRRPGPGSGVEGHERGAGPEAEGALGGVATARGEPFEVSALRRSMPRLRHAASQAMPSAFPPFWTVFPPLQHGGVRHDRTSGNADRAVPFDFRRFPAVIPSPLDPDVTAGSARLPTAQFAEGPASTPHGVGGPGWEGSLATITLSDAVGARAGS